MSYIVEIIRPIQREELISIVGSDESLTLLDQGDNWIELEWSDGNEKAQFSLAQGRITVTTPTNLACNKAQELAESLNAEVIGEEEQLQERGNTDTGIIAGRATWIGWPILVLALLLALIWRW